MSGYTYNSKKIDDPKIKINHNFDKYKLANLYNIKFSTILK